MIAVALVGTLGLLGYTLVATRTRQPWWALALGLVAALIGPTFLCLALPPVAVQAGVGLLALPLLAWPRNGRRAYLVVSVCAFVAGWVVVAVNAVAADREYARLRAVYPFESLADRLSPQPPGVPPPFDQAALAAAENRYEEQQTLADRWYRGRTELLRVLHEGQVDAFAEAAGFGVGRMPRVWPTADRLADPEPPEPPSSPWLADMVRADALDFTDPWLADMVRADALDFTDPRRWGYRRGEQVAGFLPHALRRQPGPAGGWAVERVELVGLLLKENPRVYVSASLPRMDEVGRLETRHPDGFESPALARLRSGEELVHDAPLGRLLGAIRAAKQCLACHGGERGELLGAFSYHLRSQ